MSNNTPTKYDLQELTWKTRDSMNKILQYHATVSILIHTRGIEPAGFMLDEEGALLMSLFEDISELARRVESIGTLNPDELPF